MELKEQVSWSDIYSLVFPFMVAHYNMYNMDNQYIIQVHILVISRSKKFEYLLKPNQTASLMHYIFIF